MKQTTLFDNQIKRLPHKVNSEIPRSNSNVNVPQLKKVSYKASSNDKDVIEGFNTSIRDWIYPTNYPVRDYQLQIVQECLFKNTLVCLPTGLGKTFIASVVIYNFYRWYPNGKIIFVAPTRPLVCQQMLACQDTIPIDNSDFVELTGSINRNHRINIWKEKRVFFLTAQVLVNDLTSNICPGTKIVLIVLDEAHKASKNHAYCQVIREITSEKHKNRSFRVIGLSATPGDDIQAIQDVIHNLLISHIELRTDECKDIKMYSHERQVEEVIVPLGTEVISIRDKLLNICSPIIERLKKAGAINGNYSSNNVTKYGLLKMKEEYKAKFFGFYSHNALADFSQAISLYYAVELVQQHGLKPTFLFFANAISNSHNTPQILDLMMNKEFMDFFAYLEKRLDPDVFILGHPKLGKLQEIVKNHFSSKSASQQQMSRIIIFSQIRDSVDEIIKLLKEMEPMVRPIAFMGKTKHVSQREQMEAMQLFKEGTVNVLVSTCIGEEGLDIGEVDLIICFDSQKSPIRLIQRAGRTGRKRQGRVVMLLSEGKEVRNYRTSLSKKSHIHAAIFEGYKHLVFYPNNPRMIPLGIDPVISYQNVTIEKRVEPIAKKASKRCSKQKPIVNCNFMPSQQISLKINPDIPDGLQFRGESAIADEAIFSRRYRVHRHKSSFYKTQPTFKISHSSLTTDFISILKLKEMHNRGKTNMLFHLSSSRILNIDEPMTESEEENSQHSLDSFSLSLSSIGDEDDTPYEPVACLIKIDKSAVIASPVKPLKSPMADAHFHNFLTRLEHDKPDLINYLDREFLAVFNTPDLSSINYPTYPKNEELIPQQPNVTIPITECPLNDSIQTIRDYSTNPTKHLSSIQSSRISPLPIRGLCTSTPIAAKTRSFPMQNILTSFHIPQNSTTNSENKRKNDILSSFNVPPHISFHSIDPCTSSFASKTERSNISNNNPVNDNYNNNKSKFGFESALELFNDSNTVTFEVSSDLFSDDNPDVSKSDDGKSILSDFDASFEKAIENITSKLGHVSKQLPKSGPVLESVAQVDADAHIDIEETQLINNPNKNESVEDLFSDDMDIYSPLSGRSLSPNYMDNSFSPDEPDISDKLDQSVQIIEVIEPRSKLESKENVETISDLSDSFLNTKKSEFKSPSQSPSFGSDFCFDSDIEGDFLNNDAHNPPNNLPLKNVGNPIRQFFDSQAQDVDKKRHSDDEDDDDFENDCFDNSFIDDNENCGVVNTQMHQIYLQSIKSPKTHQNTTPLSKQSPNHNGFIYSQALSSDDDYLLDSFVIPDNYVTPKKKRKRLNLRNESSPGPSKKFKRLAPLNDSFY